MFVYFRKYGDRGTVKGRQFNDKPWDFLIEVGERTKILTGKRSTVIYRGLLL